jgi:hypothetical protein
MGWLGLQWQLLEEVDRHCARGILRGDQLLRCKLECHLLEQALARLADAGHMNRHELAQVKLLLEEMQSLLALGPSHAMDLLQTGVHAAQNRLYDEVLALAGVGTRAQDSRAVA